MAMDRALKTRWIKALLSGRYAQGRGRLGPATGRGPNCCLGVLGRVARIPENEWRGCSEDEILSPLVLKKVGLTEVHQDHLSMLNDGENGFCRNPGSFREIAGWIQKNIKVKKTNRRVSR